jgi:hypothetical protein
VEAVALFPLFPLLAEFVVLPAFPLEAEPAALFPLTELAELLPLLAGVFDL